MQVLNHSYSKILLVALPLMISGFIQSIVMFTDSAFMARYSTLAFDAVGNGGLMYVTMYMCLWGMADGSQIIIARRIGENRLQEVGSILGSSLVICFVLSILLFSLLHFYLPKAILYYSGNFEIAALQGDFLRIRSYSLFFAIATLCIQALFLACGRTTIVLLAALTTAVSNVVFDYLLIFGHFGFPEMGHRGAALASTLGECFGMLFLVIALIASKEQYTFNLRKTLGLSKTAIKSLIKVGSPLMFQSFFALATWTLFFTWIEMKGAFELTVSQNIRSIYFLAFVPIWGFSGTTKTYISQYLGANKLTEIPIIQKKIQLLTLLFTALFFHGAILYPEELISLVNPNQLYVSKSAAILKIVSVSILIYGFVSVYFQTIHASGNTRHSMLIELSTVLIYLLFSYLFILEWDLDIVWVWTTEYIYFGSIGLFSILYLRFTNWKQKKI